MSTPSPSRNGVSHPDAGAARDPPTLTAQLAFAKMELAMARVDAQPNWWLADQRQTPDQWGRRLACLEAICATLARCCDVERTPPIQDAQSTAPPQDGPRPPRNGHGRTPPNLWASRTKPRIKRAQK
jgi:hypothetical protein